VSLASEAKNVTEALKGETKDMSGKAVLSASLAAMLFIAPAVARAQVQQGQQQAQPQNQAMQLVLHFEGDKTDLSDAAKATLDQRIPMFRANPEMRIVIMPDVCANMTGMNTGDDLKAGGDTMQGRAGDTTGITPPDSTVEAQRLPSDTGGAVIDQDTGEAKIGETGTGDAGNVEKNRELTRKRAEAARDYLVKHGVEGTRIDVAVSKSGKDTNKQPAGNRPAGDTRNPAEQGQGQQGQWPQNQGQSSQGQWQHSQANCPQAGELKAGEQQFRLLIATDARENYNKQNRNQDTKEMQDTTQKQGDQQPY
jgi:hypothetical protein